METDHHPTSAERLARVRAAMRAHVPSVDYLVVRGTDRYLNEYVPTAESTRVWLTGFTGSTGDALVGHEGAWLFVDGRYYVQADRELDSAPWQVVRVALGTSNESACANKLVELAGEAGRALAVGYEPDRFGLQTRDAFAALVEPAAVTLHPITPSPVETARSVEGAVPESAGALRAVDEALAGRTVREKIALVAAWLQKKKLDVLALQKLDEIAYVTNLRGDELPYQSTFRATALVTPREVLLAVRTGTVPDAVKAARPDVRFVTETELARALTDLGATLGRSPRVGVDAASVTVAFAQELGSLSAEAVRTPSPLVAMKSRKTPEELAAMCRAFARADRVVVLAQRWLLARVAAGERVTEVDFAGQVERLFRESGAVGLSFKVISAFGTNGAVVHHPPSATQYIRAGEMMLLDTGCYYADGYATDLTRTFFVSDTNGHRAPSAAQRRLYTLTLKAAIAGMTARFPRGAVGAQIDGITRAPLWAAGYEYAHGTGHGVGINVHESPPRIANVSLTPLEEGQVFSIEPGVYLEGVGGVRIENLCTVVPDADHPGFLRVEPLTFSPLDPALIDKSLLNDAEWDFLTRYAARAEAVPPA